ncbi:hypothetical protein DL96DRAFT_1590395 [Flagelloscypha sp. PMI_526]|nr:hypothetical protein DL96DRAFT_1590395 [Flagelloscypha sp. PMI_526]
MKPTHPRPTFSVIRELFAFGHYLHYCPDIPCDSLHLMGTPKPGNVQHHDLEAIRTNHPTAYENWRDWVEIIAWLVGFTATAAGYNIAACALGRFFLDHFRLWDRVIPSGVSEIDKYAELIAALLSSWLSTPLAAGLIYVLYFPVEDWLRRRRPTFRIPDGFRPLFSIVLLIEWSLLPVSGAILHPRFHYVDPVSLLGAYFFGSLLLIPWLGPLIWFGYRAWPWYRRHQ